jgi:hypothetical protein
MKRLRCIDFYRPDPDYADRIQAYNAYPAQLACIYCME